MAAEPVDFEPRLPLAAEHLAGADSYRVDDVDGLRVGSLRAILLDATRGEVTWGVVKLGRFGRCSAVPAPYLAPGADRVWTPLPRRLIRAAASLDPRDGLTVEAERSLLTHYGATGRRGRLAELTDRSDPDPGSIPAGTLPGV